MENSWQVKCGPTLQSSAPSVASSSSQGLRNQTERNAGYYSYSHDPRDLRLKVLGTVQDPLPPSYPDLSSQKSCHVNLGNSFLALLSGPPSLLQCDFKELSNSKLTSDGNSSVVNATGNGISLRFSGSPLEYTSEQNLQSGADFCPSNSTRAVAGSNCSTNVVLPGRQSPDLETTAIHCMVPGTVKANDSLSSNVGWHGAVPPNAGKLSSTKVQTSQMKSLEENFSISNPSSNFLSDCPRVFCLGTGGFLLISTTGLLGIVCSCHYLHMSVLKFCEHLGLCGVNPGDAVHMDNGETIAQWRKLYFQKFGIRVPEDQSDWDWPEGLSATSGLVKSRTALPNISHLVHSSEGLSSSGQLSDKVMVLNCHTNQNVVIDASQNKQKRDAQCSNNRPLKSLFGTSQSQMHPTIGSRVMDSTISKSFGSGLHDGCQSISAYNDIILKNGDLSITHPSMQDLTTMGQKSDFTMFKNAPNGIFVDRDAAFSNIELKLGQPYQSSQNSKVLDRPAPGLHLLDTVVNPSKLVFSEQMKHNNCRGKVELVQSLYFSTGSCSPNTKREQSHLNLGNNGFAVSNINNAAILDKSRGNLVQSAAVPPTNFNLVAENSVQIKSNDNILNCLEHTAPHTQYYEPRFAKYDSSNVPWNSGNGLERQLNEISSHGLIDKGKVMKLVADGSSFVKDAGSRISKECEFSTSRPHFSVLPGSSCDLYQWSTVPLEAPEARKFSSHSEHIPLFGSSLHLDHVNQRSFASSVGSGIVLPSQVVTKGLPLASSTYLSDQTPTLHREESTGVSPHLLDENLQMLALRQKLELSKQQHAFSSFGMNKWEERYDGISYSHHSLAESSAPGKQCNRPGPTSGREASEASARARLTGATNMNGCSDFLIGNGCCDLLALIRGIPIHPKEVAVLGQHSCEQLSMRHERNEMNIAGPSECEKCCRVPSVCSQHSCNCSVHVHCFKKNLESTVGSFPIALKEQRGLINGEASVIFGSKFAENNIVPNNEIISLDQGRKLNEKLPNYISSHASQWRDVPSKVKKVSTLMRRDTSAECINITMQTKDSFKENEASNISSGSSAPAVTELSVEVNKMDYSCADAGNTGCVSNIVLDEGSGIDKCWSSDDARGSERSEEFLGNNCKTSFKESGSSKNANHEPSRSLLDELKLINSLTWKKGRKQIQTSTSLQDGNNLSNKLNRCSEKGKKNTDCFSIVHDEGNGETNSAEVPSFASKQICSLSNQRKTSGACLNQQNSEHRLSTMSSMKKRPRKRDIYKIYNDNEGKEVCSIEFKAGARCCETPEILDGKRCKKDCTSTSFGQSLIQEQTHGGPRTRNKYNSKVSLNPSLNCQASSQHCKSRPIVYGKYGELSDGKVVGNLLKPAKIVPLSRVLKLARRCTLPKNDKPTFTSLRGMKKTHSDGADEFCNRFHLLKTEKESRSHNAAACGRINNETSSEKMKNRGSSRENRFGEDLSILEIERYDINKDSVKEDSIAYARLKPKSKEIRKRSISELTADGKGSHRKTFSLSKISKCIPEVTKGTILRSGEDGKHGLCEVAEKAQEQTCSSLLDSDSFCCVCGSSNKDEINNLLECNRCLIKLHQACYGVSRVPKGHWYCRPCRTNSRNIVCVLCGYGGGAMTQALRSRTIVKSLLRVWNVETECKALSVKALESSLSRLNPSAPKCEEGTSFPMCQPENAKPLASAVCKLDMLYTLDVLQNSLCVSKLKVDNSITAGFLDSTTKQWVHMVCGLWTPGTRCPNVDTMSAFDVSGAPRPRADVVCSICSRPGGSCIKCRVLNCSVRFHPWCAHQKGLLQSEVEGIDNENVGFYGRCALHAAHPTCESDSDPDDKIAGGSTVEEVTCARTEGYKGRKRDGFRHNYCQLKGEVGCHVPQEQLNAWIHINGQKSCIQGVPKPPTSEIEHDCRKEFARYKQGRGWKHLVVYKSGIHALGLYTSRFISRGEMVVEYVGEIVGQRIADKREYEYQSGRKLQYKSACYFFRIDKEHIIDATRKGGIARFVNHSCLPNCVAKVISVRNEKKVVCFAERDIFPGEEITYDYHFNHEDEGKKIPCFCNSKNCRRYLN